MHSVDPADEALFTDLESGLSQFPRFREMLPQNFPRASRFGISRKAMQEYSDIRKDRFWHQLNLPLLLHAYLHSDDAKVRSLMRSVLTTLEDFVVRLGALRGARSLLSPLWDDLWTDTPQLWSVVGCAYMALCYQAAELEVLGFESPVGGESKDDITVRLSGKLTHIEVEAHHRADFADKSDDDLEDVLGERANIKAGKFRNLPADEVGVVAVLCVIAAEPVNETETRGLRI